MSKIKKEIDLSGLPKRGKHIDWKNSIGCKCKFIYDDIIDEVKIIDYENIKRSNVSFIYDNEVYKMQTDPFAKCCFGKILGKYGGDFKIEIGAVFKDKKRNLIITDREIRKDRFGRKWRMYKYTCNNCGWIDGWIEESKLLDLNRGCSCCYGRTVVPGINDITTTAPWMIKYFVNPEDAKKYTESSNKKICPICPDCGRVKKKPIMIGTIYRVGSIGCNCSDGKPYDEKLFYHIVNEQLGLNMLWGANKNDYPWMDKYIYDFVDENNKIIWELDGGLGHGNKSYRESEKTVQETIKDDKCKDKLAENNGYRVIRTDTYYKNIKNRFEYIKNSILNSELSEKYNLSTIDWDKAHEFALSNLVKEVCEYYEIHFEKSQTEIAEEFNLSKHSIMRYLKQGEKVGWCFNVKERSRKSISTAIIKTHSKKVLCIELNKEFDSVVNCEKQLNKMYNKNFNKASISGVCRGEHKHHKGFTFKYV